MEKAKIIRKTRHNGEKYTLLTVEILRELEFENRECNFEFFKDMAYWVKNGICLFYNPLEISSIDNKFYIGYAEMRQGKYVAVAFRWIDSLEELTEIYESIKQKKITDSI